MTARRLGAIVSVMMQAIGLLGLVSIFVPSEVKDRVGRAAFPRFAVAESVDGSGWRRPVSGERYRGTVVSSGEHDLVLRTATGTVSFRHLDGSWRYEQTVFSGVAADVKVTDREIDFDLGADHYYSYLQ